MTAPITGRTATYGIEYPVEGEPMWTTRSKLERSAKAIEAALLARGITPPDAPTWATLGTDSKWLSWPGWTPGQVVNGFARPGGATGIGALYRVLGRVCWINAEVSHSTGWAANVLLATLPVAPYRPEWRLGVGYGGAAMPFYVDQAGGIRIANAGGANAGGWLTMSFAIGN